jgi:hypothetical protein
VLTCSAALQGCPRAGVAGLKACATSRRGVNTSEYRD